MRRERKVFRYSPGHPDSGGANYYLEEHWLAGGLGLVYKWREPNTITQLHGCVISGDTFGILTSVKSITSREITNQYRIKQNYPNPFNPNTRIEFDLPEAANVTLHVFDILGREVDVLVKEWLNAGTYQIVWSGSRVASGVYVCRLGANGFGGSIRMLFTK
jgi:hypothetical protein